MDKFNILSDTKAQCLKEAHGKLELALRMTNPKLSEMAFNLAAKAELAAFDGRA